MHCVGLLSKYFRKYDLSIQRVESKKFVELLSDENNLWNAVSMALSLSKERLDNLDNNGFQIALRRLSE
jgi:hypothetical protein